jgi:hypothetical protein
VFPRKQRVSTSYRRSPIAADASDPSSAYRDMFAGAACVLEETDFIDPCPIGTIAREVANTSEPLRIAARNAFDSWIRAARDHLSAAGVPPDEADELAAVFVSTLEGTFVVSRTQRSSKPLVAAGRYLAGLVERAITEATSARPQRRSRTGATRDRDLESVDRHR